MQCWTNLHITSVLMEVVLSKYLPNKYLLTLVFNYKVFKINNVVSCILNRNNLIYLYVSFIISRKSAS